MLTEINHEAREVTRRRSPRRSSQVPDL